MAVYTNLESFFNFKDIWPYQKANQLAANDAFLKAILGGYRRPVLTYVSASLVDVENNTGNSNETSVLFPDGDMRTVVEDTSSVTKYRRFDITAAASFTSGTEDSGVRSGISEATNTWYAIYAVKSLIDTSKFVLAGDTTLPLQANVATLNSRYGTGGWAYLGLIRNGDNNTATGDILKFVQAQARTIFYNATTGSVGTISSSGTILATTAGAATLTYTYAGGTGTAQLPQTITVAIYSGTNGPIASTVSFQNSAANTNYTQEHPNALSALRRAEVPATEGAKLINGAGSSITYDILLVGFVDGFLS